jgi:hypothetical protein
MNPTKTSHAPEGLAVPAPQGVPVYQKCPKVYN